MFHIKVNGESGYRYIEPEAPIAQPGAGSTLADAGVYTSEVAVSSGIILVDDATNEDSAVIAVHNNGGTLTLTKLSGADAITIAKDTADSINVYVEGGVVKAQNLTGSDADVTLKVYA